MTGESIRGIRQLGLDTSFSANAEHDPVRWVSDYEEEKDPNCSVYEPCEWQLRVVFLVASLRLQIHGKAAFCVAIISAFERKLDKVKPAQAMP
ncbi:hypothetical protein GN958_ATG03319 [Phytophthora infestans]|uniref:Uncharacterized protein n=1 Tax=Phytophthora infestans TaxID=4787 RepID=A0A8S9V3G3_PHYIN|nr:hypothetical protein GN958_ATG19856 [Phytophthora infestans]KAF4135258.1 hypothetical protein GN958_ATG15550 [Phytophthora infestans]KAF4135568.1 hypothetical protein GN958_ATG15241 [Phytophthora infestans]KAF4147490.1 hypothetical protein GN958_ATG03319 [Phytophthora infestans]